ncbi:MAG: ATP synthase F1 subunit epsilon [Phycisphaerae bacterium]
MSKATGKEIQLSVITPERQVVSEPVHEVVIPAHDGELGVLVDRAPLMCELGVGQVRYRDIENHTQRVYVEDGFAQVHDNQVIVLTSDAVRAQEVTPELIAAAQKRAADEPSGADAQARRAAAAKRASALRRLQGA